MEPTEEIENEIAYNKTIEYVESSNNDEEKMRNMVFCPLCQKFNYNPYDLYRHLRESHFFLIKETKATLLVESQYLYKNQALCTYLNEVEFFIPINIFDKLQILSETYHFLNQLIHLKKNTLPLLFFLHKFQTIDFNIIDSLINPSNRITYPSLDIDKILNNIDDYKMYLGLFYHYEKINYDMFSDQIYYTINRKILFDHFHTVKSLKDTSDQIKNKYNSLKNFFQPSSKTKLFDYSILSKTTSNIYKINGLSYPYSKNYFLHHFIDLYKDNRTKIISFCPYDKISIEKIIFLRDRITTDYMLCNIVNTNWSVTKCNYDLMYNDVDTALIRLTSYKHNACNAHYFNYYEIYKTIIDEKFIVWGEDLILYINRDLLNSIKTINLLDTLMAVPIIHRIHS